MWAFLLYPLQLYINFVENENYEEILLEKIQKSHNNRIGSHHVISFIVYTIRRHILTTSLPFQLTKIFGCFSYQYKKYYLRLLHLSTLSAKRLVKFTSVSVHYLFSISGYFRIEYPYHDEAQTRGGLHEQVQHWSQDRSVS